MIEAIAPDRVAFVWPEAEPLLRKACDRTGERTTHDVLVSLVSGHAQLWRVHNRAWAVSEIVNYPRKKVANLTLVAGSGAPQWAHELQDAIVQWAKHYQADEVRVVGRRGWLRWLPPHAETSTVITLCLRHSSPPLAS